MKKGRKRLVYVVVYNDAALSVDFLTFKEDEVPRDIVIGGPFGTVQHFGCDKKAAEMFYNQLVEKYTYIRGW